MNDRAEAEARVMDAGRSLGAAAVLFHSAIAGRMGLTPVEEKALDWVLRSGPMTAGDLAQATGLAPSSVTALIDRLVRKGFVARIADDGDGRRVRVAAVADRLAAFAPLFEDFVSRLNGLNATFSPAELALVARYMQAAASEQRAAAAALGAESRPSGP